MKTLCILLFAVLIGAFTLPSHAQAGAETSSVTLEWDPNPEPDLGGYRMHWGTVSGTYTKTVDVGPVTTYEVKELVPGTTYYFAATAYGTGGLESPFSNEVVYTVPMLLAPTLLTLANGMLTWQDANNGVTRWYIEKADAQGAFLPYVTVSAKEHKLVGLPPGTHTFRVRAATLEGAQSPPSNVVTATVPGAPGGTRIKRKLTVHRSKDLKAWDEVVVVNEEQTTLEENPLTHYRLTLEVVPE